MCRIVQMLHFPCCRFLKVASFFSAKSSPPHIWFCCVLNCRLAFDETAQKRVYEFGQKLDVKNEGLKTHCVEPTLTLCRHGCCWHIPCSYHAFVGVNKASLATFCSRRSSVYANLLKSFSSLRPVENNV